MWTWHIAATYCEEMYGMGMNTEEGYFVCPECGEPLYEEDYRRHYWDSCPVCGFIFDVEESYEEVYAEE